MNDKEGRKWLLQKLYDNGIKYIAFSTFYGGYVGVQETPRISDKGEVFNDIAAIITIGDILPDFNKPNWLDIGEYLGVIDWGKVPVDTPVLVSKDKIKWEKRYFAKYECGKVFAFRNGTTSWSNKLCPFGWNYAMLAGGYDEK